MAIQTRPVNDPAVFLDDSITSNVLKFADDTKLFRKVNTDGDKQHLQNDLDRLVKWSDKWQMILSYLTLAILFSRVLLRIFIFTMD